MKRESQLAILVPQFRPPLILTVLIVLVFTSGCAYPIEGPAHGSVSNMQPSVLPTLPPNLIPVSLKSKRLTASSAPCQNSFVTHTLDHVTAIMSDTVHLFDSNGAGVAINDLDNDDDLDIVLANLDGLNAIFWNEGALTFRKETVSYGDSRAVTIIDIDGDGWQEIAFSRRKRTRPVLLRNAGAEGKPGFVPMDQFRIKNPYTMSWADLDGDGDLDLVTGSYDAEVEEKGYQAQLPKGGGVIYYENQGEHFTPTYLAYAAQTLAILLVDLDEDGLLDIMIGNDFQMPDQVWLRQNDGWKETELFSTTTMDTMSFDAADIDNDGYFEIFATDMKPYTNNSETLAAWQPVMEDMHNNHIEGDPQVMENVLQVRNESGRFENRASIRGLEATGWSWSSKFGDLDNDGFVDAYIVNGMIAAEMFRHLPNNELIEENQLLQNDGTGRFRPNPNWGLNSTASGRGMSMADLDNDGDLDIVVNNLLAPAQIFENRLCGGAGLEVDLFWPGSKNTRAIGAQLTLHTSSGSYYRQVRAASGYLSGDPARVHFGFPKDSEVIRLDIRWPDGRFSSTYNLKSQLLVTAIRD